MSKKLYNTPASHNDEQEETNEVRKALRDKYWIELGPTSAYVGTIAEATARAIGSLSPDADILNFDSKND